MAAIDQVANKDFDLCWARGDNDSKTITIKDDVGVAINISGWTFSMAVNTDLNPSGITNEIFKAAGAFVTDGTDGKVSFTPPSGSLDNVVAPGVAFYDINRLTPSKKTLIKGKVIFIQDVDKT